MENINIRTTKYELDKLGFFKGERIEKYNLTIYTTFSIENSNKGVKYYYEDDEFYYFELEEEEGEYKTFRPISKREAIRKAKKYQKELEYYDDDF